MENYRYNRIESETAHEYLTDFDGTRTFDKSQHKGFIKCKLFHGNGFSLVIPDQIYIQGKELLWIQPLYFGPNIISKTEKFIECKLSIDISFGACIEIIFRNTDHVNSLSDGAELYKCIILGPRDLPKYSTGKARWNSGSKPQVLLFHHTSEEAVSKILESEYLLPSSWNIQGNKKLANIKYVYFTCLDKIVFEDDLHQIAMASHGQLRFRLDQNFSGGSDLIINVYRENTMNRSHTISKWLDSILLAPQPIFKHSPPGEAVYYEIVQPFTCRVGLEPGSVLKISGDQVETSDLKRLSFVILGDAITTEGLAAPFNEEETNQILKIENQIGYSTNLDFWMEEANKDHFSKITVEPNEFDEE